MSKPTVSLLEGKKITAEQVAALFRKLTGREPTPEEVEYAKENLKPDPKKQ